MPLTNRYAPIGRAITLLALLPMAVSCSKSATAVTQTNPPVSAGAPSIELPDDAPRDLGSAKAALTNESKAALRAKAEAGAIGARTSAELTRADEICGLASELAPPIGPGCQTAKPRLATLMKHARLQQQQEEAAQRQREQQEEASRQRCAAANDLRFRCLEKCNDRLDQLEAAGREAPLNFTCESFCDSHGYPEPKCSP